MLARCGMDPRLVPAEVFDTNPDALGKGSKAKGTLTYFLNASLMPLCALFYQFEGLRLDNGLAMATL